MARKKQEWSKDDLTLARLDLAEYGMFMDPFITPRMAQFHYEIAYAMQKAIEFHPDYQRIIINAPPRHGKSQWVQQYAIPWGIGNFPWLQVMCASFTSEVACRQSRLMQRYMQSDKYKALFGNRFVGKATEAEIDTGSVERDAYGFIKFGGVDGGFTSMPANLIIIDDPYKGRKSADSPAKRKTVWDWFQDDMLTRAESPCSIVIIHTRWHEEDLSGELQRLEPDIWKTIRFPYIQDRDPVPYDKRIKGEGLWPGIKLTPKAYPHLDTQEEKVIAATIDYKKEFDRMYKVNPYGAQALLQNDPKPRDGDGWKEESKRYYTIPPNMMLAKCHTCIVSVDCSYGKLGKKNDPQGISIVGQHGSDYYLIKAFDKKVSFDDVLSFLKRMLPTVNHTMPLVLVEDKALGPHLFTQLKKVYSNCKEFKVGSTSRDSRYEFVAVITNDGRFFLPAEEHQDDDTKLCIKQMWQRSACKHDDMGDATVQAIIYMEAKAGLRRTLERQVTSTNNSVSSFMDPTSPVFGILKGLTRRNY